MPIPQTRGERATVPAGGARVAREAPGARCGLLGEVLGFAAAGLCAYLTDLALFVWLRGAVGLGPLPAKALSFVAACGIAYAGNALGPYRGRVGSDCGPGAFRFRRYGLFAAINLAGAVVQLLCLTVTHYGLGLTSPWADTVSGAGVGMALATVLRFWATRTFVFGAKPSARDLSERVS
ncbi:GtrA family protein [Streptomyces odontomachi]|uniref:GtrA family protein n=1 Tax=Streptomyces odontomachi TaxID=2944940 RepID=UPI00210D7A43|nr:GtrA family protein [Streptomyces sp. ODS25]